jgi:hypothetical protein
LSAYTYSTRLFSDLGERNRVQETDNARAVIIVEVASIVEIMHDNRPPRGPRQAGGESAPHNQNMASFASPNRQHSEGMLNLECSSVYCAGLMLSSL